MKILSFDVGIKNLAYCYTEHDEDKSTHILDWGIIDLIDNKQQCYHNNCQKPIKLYKNDVFSCKKHSTCHPEYNINHSNTSINKIKKLSMTEIKILCKTYQITEHKYKKDMIDELNTYFKTKCFSLYKQENAKDVNLIKIGRNMTILFDSKFNNYEIDLVIIENQISSLAARMKSIQGMITQYFIICHPTVDIKYISSFNKLKLFSEKKLSYKERKTLSVKKTDELINEYNVSTKWIELFNNHKKKDDLADCFLQTIIYMRLT